MAPGVDAFKLEQIFLSGERLVDGCLHRLDSTPRRFGVERLAARRGPRVDGDCRRATLAQQLMRDVEPGHDGDAIRSAHLAGVADLAHAPIEQRNGLQQFVALVFLARDLEIAPEDRYVERYGARCV